MEGCSKQAKHTKKVRYRIYDRYASQTHSHMNRHMEAGGATVGFTVL